MIPVLNQSVTKHLTLLVHRIFPILLFIGLAWGQSTTSFSPDDDKDSDKLVQSFRSDMGKYYTITYSGEFLGQKNNKVYFKPINDIHLKILQLKEIKELKQDNKVLIKNGKWKIEHESIKPYRGAFIDLENINAEESSKLKRIKSSHIMIGCGIISAAAIGVIWLAYHSLEFSHV